MSRTFRICFIGDSLVAGTGDPQFLGWAGRVCIAARTRGHDVTCYNLGIRANTSAQILARWRREAEERHVREQDCRLIFSFGVNDTKDVDGKRIVEPQQAVAQAREILGAAKAWLPTLMVGPPPIDEEMRNARIADLSGRLSALCRDLGVPYLDTFGAFYSSGAWMKAVQAGDGVHPLAAGYEEWARLIDGWPAWRAWAP
jgi:lysophospholipase L1-like esterase